MTLLLSPTSLRHTLDAISAHIAILDKDGTILGVNRPWRIYMDRGRLDLRNYGIGTHYVDFCGRVCPGDRETAGTLAKRIRDVLSRDRDVQVLTMTCRCGERKRWFNVRVCRPDGGDDSCVLMTHEDITDLKLAEERLKYRIDFERLIFSLSSRFIRLRSDEVDRGIVDSLCKLGLFCEVDRSYLFILSADGKTLDNSHEWCAEGIAPQIDNLQGLPVGEIKWWMDRLHQGEAIHIPRVAALPPEAAPEKEILAAQGIRSLVVVPVTLGESLIGFLGFDSVRREKTWDEEVIELLRLVGEMLVNALERKRHDRVFRAASAGELSA